MLRVVFSRNMDSDNPSLSILVYQLYRQNFEIEMERIKVDGFLVRNLFQDISDPVQQCHYKHVIFYVYY